MSVIIISVGFYEGLMVNVSPNVNLSFD